MCHVVDEEKIVVYRKLDKFTTYVAKSYWMIRKWPVAKDWWRLKNLFNSKSSETIFFVTAESSGELKRNHQLKCASYDRWNTLQLSSNNYTAILTILSQINLYMRVKWTCCPLIWTHTCFRIRAHNISLELNWLELKRSFLTIRTKWIAIETNDWKHWWRQSVSQNIFIRVKDSK